MRATDFDEWLDIIQNELSDLVHFGFFSIHRSYFERKGLNL